MDYHEIAERIRKADEWSSDDCAALCEAADMSEEWDAADGDTFESALYAAAKKLNVKI